MSVEINYQLRTPQQTEAELTIRMTVGEWERVAEILKEAAYYHPLDQFKQAIRSVIEDARTTHNKKMEWSK